MRPIILSIYGPMLDVLSLHARIEVIDPALDLRAACLTRSSGPVDTGYALLHWRLPSYADERHGLRLIERGIAELRRSRVIGRSQNYVYRERE